MRSPCSSQPVGAQPGIPELGSKSLGSRAGSTEAGENSAAKRSAAYPARSCLGLGRMDQDLVETKACADVVPVRVRLQDAGAPRRERCDETGEVPGARTRVQHRDVAAAFDQVALHILAMMRLADHGHRVRKPPHLEPSLIRRVIHPRCHAPPSGNSSRQSSSPVKICLHWHPPSLPPLPSSPPSRPSPPEAAEPPSPPERAQRPAPPEAAKRLAPPEAKPAPPTVAPP